MNDISSTTPSVLPRSNSTGRLPGKHETPEAVAPHRARAHSAPASIDPSVMTRISGHYNPDISQAIRNLPIVKREKAAAPVQPIDPPRPGPATAAAAPRGFFRSIAAAVTDFFTRVFNRIARHIGGAAQGHGQAQPSLPRRLEEMREDSKSSVSRKLPDLDEVRRAPGGRDALEKHLKATLNAENLYFIEACEKCRNGPANTRVEALEAIRDIFVVEDAPFQVNLSDRNRKDFVDTLGKHKRGDIPGEALERALDNALTEIEALLRTDPFTRFPASEAGKAFLKDVWWPSQEASTQAPS